MAKSSNTTKAASDTTDGKASGTQDQETNVSEARATLDEAQADLNKAENIAEGEDMQRDIDASLAGTTPPALTPDAGGPAPGTTGDADADTKVSVKTTGPFMIHDPYTSTTVGPNNGEDDEAQEVIKTSIISNAIADGRLVEA